MKQSTKDEARKWIVTIIQILMILGFFWIISLGFQSIGTAEDATAYILCKPGDYINARSTAAYGKNVIGRLETGDEIQVDGKTKNGFAHCTNPTFEDDECWVYTGYIVFDKPQWMNGRTATVVSNYKLAERKSMTGTVNRWLKPGTEIQVFWWTEEWCVTNRGFVMTKYIELDGE